MWIVCRGALALALCVLGTAHVSSAASLLDREPLSPHLQPHLQRELRPAALQPLQRRARAAEHWLALIAEIARIGAMSEQARSDKSSSADATLTSVLLQSLAKLGGGGGGGAPQVLVLPVPVPVPAPQYRPSSQVSSAALSLEALLARFNTSPLNNNDAEYYLSSQLSPSLLDTSKVSSSNKVQPHQHPQVYAPESISNSREPLMLSVPQDPVSPLDTFPTSTFTQQLPPQNVVVNETSDLPTRFSLEEHRAQNAISFPPIEDSQQLLLQFHEQVASNPLLPPVVLETANDEVTDVKDPAQDVSLSSPSSSRKDPSKQPPEKCRATCLQQSGAGGVDEHAPSPPPPRFERTMMLEAVLTVTRAGYSEPYTLWWDAASGASRIDHHKGAASSYRLVRADGRMQAVHVRVDRTGAADVRRCVLRAPRRVALAERAPPVLPDLSDFSFAGYVQVSAPSRVERWTRVAGGAGGAGGERLTYRHELLVARAPDNHTTTPLRYAVAVDSSLLGANCDSYVHRFFKVFTRHYDAATFDLDLGDACDLIENTDRIERVEPLREFALPLRDPVYDELFDRYKREYNRQYADELEEAVRKNVLIQTSRFVSSGNREGASFEQKTNFLSDRLKVELEPIYGAQESNTSAGIAFPYSKAELRRLASRLPLKFDWRERGGVTRVRNQMACPSCWAFSVVGAVEGALFAKTGRLVSLSEQSLVDCGNRTGANGCGRTWPAAAYDYVRDYGLPALDEYSPYVAKVQQCAAERAPPVTRIAGHVRVPPGDVLALKVAIRRHGPTVVLVDAREQSLQTSPNLYYSDAKCKKEDSNHAMLAVGWTQHRGAPYFILKNSWSAGWARGGYVYVRADTNTCGVLRRPSYPLLRRADVLRVPAGAPAN